MGQGQRLTSETGVRRAAVLGSPIGHSLSPVLHRAAYAALGLDWRYDALDVPSGGLQSFLAGLGDEWAGLSLTMPLKVEAMRLASFVEPQAARLGVVNTLLPSGLGEARLWVGANTDVHGVVAAFAEAGVMSATRGVVVGGGATATSAVAALGVMGVKSPAVLVRSRASAGPLLRAATQLGLDARLVDLASPEAIDYVAGADVVVSTVPAEAGASLAERLATAVSDPPGALLDVVYSPLVTPLLAWWPGTTVSGVRMLLHQAGEQVRLMTGLDAPLAAMSVAVEDAIRPAP